MKKKKRHYFRPLRKTYRPWQAPLDPEMVDDFSLEEEPVNAEDLEWTAEEWERIWRNTSA